MSKTTTEDADDDVEHADAEDANDDVEHANAEDADNNVEHADAEDAYDFAHHLRPGLDRRGRRAEGGHSEAD